MVRGLLAVVLIVAASGCRSEGTGHEASEQAPRDTTAAVDGGAMEVGRLFPREGVTDLEGNRVDTGDLVRDGGVVFFASVTCDGCRTLAAFWKRYEHRFPSDLPIVAIVDEETDMARRYVDETGFGFPLYCDAMSVFYGDHGIDTYPTVVGVRPGGTIAFIQKRASPYLTPRRVAELIGWKLEATGE